MFRPAYHNHHLLARFLLDKYLFANNKTKKLFPIVFIYKCDFPVIFVIASLYVKVPFFRFSPIEQKFPRTQDLKVYLKLCIALKQRRDKCER